ncbi:MAG: tetratricopeptide repeat protein [Planctomycetota bacterium]
MIRCSTSRYCGVFRAAASAVLLLTSTAAAHDSPEHRVEALTLQLARKGARAELLAKRGDEHLALAEVDAAVSDFRAAVALDPKDVAARYGLCRALLNAGDFDAVVTASRAAAELTNDDHASAAFDAMLGRAQAELGQIAAACNAYARACHTGRPEADWVLQHARLLSRQERHAEAIAALESALKLQPNAALERRWVEALIAAGRHTQAEIAIEAGLARAPSAVGWRLLSAELNLARGAYADALEAATNVLRRLEARSLTAASNRLNATRTNEARRIAANANAALAKSESTPSL